MIVYRRRVAEGYQSVLAVDDREYQPMRELLRAEPGRPVGSRWKPPWVWLNTEKHGTPRKYADLPWLPGGDVLVVNRRARTVLEPIVADDAEFLPVECDDDELWFVHAWRVVPALDLEKASVRLYSSGRIMSVTRYAFTESVIRGLTCFRDPRTDLDMYVTDDVVAAAKKAGLAGAEFREVWRSLARRDHDPGTGS